MNFRIHALGSLIWLFASVAADDITNPLSLCSSQNTGSGGKTAFSIYASVGSCTTECAGYAFAILQGRQCWCSNTMPGSTVSVSECSEACAGYKTDRCGNTNEGLFGYIQLAQASSTLQASTSQSSTSSTSSTSSSTSSELSTSASSTFQTSTDTSTTTSPEATSSSASAESKFSSALASSTAAASSVVSSASSSPASSTLLPASSSAAASSSRASVSSLKGSGTSHSQSLSAVTSSVVTSSSQRSSWVSSMIPSSTLSSTTSKGSATTSATNSSSSASGSTVGANTGSNSNKSGNTGFWHDSGAVAGTFVAVGIVVVLLIALVIFFCWRRRRNQNAAVIQSPEGGRSPFMDNSFNSNQGRGAAGAFAAYAGATAAPKSHHRRGASSTSGFSDNLIPIFDQRVDPNQMYMHWENAGTQASLQDNEDYSRRVLRVANPSAD